MHSLVPNPGALVALADEREFHVHLLSHLLGYKGLGKGKGSVGVAELAELEAEEMSTRHCRALADREQEILVLLVGLLGHLDRFV